MKNWITISFICIAALLAFTTLAFAQDGTPYEPSLPDTATNEILNTFEENTETHVQLVETSGDGLVHLVMPATLDFYIDPFELVGLGSVYSRDYGIENLGGNDVEIVITDAKAVFTSEDTFEAMPFPFDFTYQTANKAIYLELSFSREGVEPIIITDPESPKEVVLAMPAGSEPVLMRVGGCINSRPAKEWLSGEVKISVSYQVNPILPDEPAQEPEPAPQEPDVPAVPDSTEPVPIATATDFDSDGLWEPVGGQPEDNGTSDADGPWEPVGWA